MLCIWPVFCASIQPVARHSQKSASVSTRALLLQNLPPGIQLPANSGEVGLALAAAMANASELQQAMDRLASAAAQSQQSIAAAAAAGGLSVLPLQLPGPDGPQQQQQQQQQMAKQQAQGQVRWQYQGGDMVGYVEDPSHNMLGGTGAGATLEKNQSPPSLSAADVGRYTGLHKSPAA